MSSVTNVLFLACVVASGAQPCDLDSEVTCHSDADGQSLLQTPHGDDLAGHRVKLQRADATLKLVMKPQPEEVTLDAKQTASTLQIEQATAVPAASVQVASTAAAVNAAAASAPDPAWCKDINCEGMVGPLVCPHTCKQPEYVPGPDAEWCKDINCSTNVAQKVCPNTCRHRGF